MNPSTFHCTLFMYSSLIDGISAFAIRELPIHFGHMRLVTVLHKEEPGPTAPAFGNRTESSEQLSDLTAVAVRVQLHKRADSCPAAQLMPFQEPCLPLPMSPGISSMLVRLCWETQQTLLQLHVWMCHPRGAGLSVQSDWAAGMLPVVRTLAECKTREESVRKDNDRTNFCGHYM